MSLRNPKGTDEKGLPPVPDDIGMNSKDSESGYWSVRSRPSTKEPKDKGKGRATQDVKHLPSAISIFTNLTPSSSHSSPTKITPRGPFSASASNLFDHPPPSPQSFRQYPGGPLAPPSPSVASQRSIATSTVTSRSTGKRLMFNTRPAPSLRSNRTMPELVAYNDVDQWGVGQGSGVGARTQTSPKKGSNTPPEVGVRRKNSSSKMLAKGLSRSLTRMGSVMKRTTSGGRMSQTVPGDEIQNRRMINRHSVVHEEMGEEWERVDMQKEVTEGDVSITRPFNVEHNLHISPDLDNLPPAWLEALKAQGLSEDDLLLIASARQRAGKVPMLRIVKGSLPPSGQDVTTPTTFSQARSRGLSTPAHLMIDLCQDPPIETPQLVKRFSWERSPTTPTGTASTAVETPSTPLSEFRKSLQKPLSPVIARSTQHTPHHRYAGRYKGQAEGDDEEEEVDHLEETPKKTKRWSDQLRGFQSSLAGLGTDDDWGSSLTSALYGDTAALSTVHESGSGGRESVESGSLASRPVTSMMQEQSSDSPEVANDTSKQSTILSSTSIDKDMEDLAISPTTSTGSQLCLSSPGSPSTPRGVRTRRKPVPSVISPLQSPTTRRHSALSTKSARTPQVERQWPTSPSAAASSDLQHIRSRSIGQSQSNDSEQDHELRTPSSNEHFPLSNSNSRRTELLLPPSPRSISEESQWTIALAQNKTPPVEVVHPWHQFGFRNDDSPPRPDPRLSMPATAGYTESSPPSRCHTPLQSDTEHFTTPEPSTRPLAQAPIPAAAGPVLPISSPRSPSSPRSARSKASSRYRKDKDPLSRLDNANQSERASIALSMISSTTDARSSFGSLKSSYVHEAKVLKAYMKDPAEHGLAGLRESDAERESGTSTSEFEGESGSEGHEQRHGLAEAALIRPGSGTKTQMTRLSDDRSLGHAKSSSQSTSTSRTSPRRSQKSSIDSTRSRRSREAPISPHPFAYQPEQFEDSEDDAMLALDDAAREIARQRGRFVSVSSAGRGSEGNFTDNTNM